MALNNDAVYTAARGYIYTAPVGTDAALSLVTGFDPAAAEALAGWDIVGHTARDELPVWGFDGGDTETRGTWQAEVIKTVVTEPASDYVTFNVHQWDESNLEFYYGENVSSETGVFSVNSAGLTPVKRALLIVITDGDYRLGFHAASVELRREDSIELAIDEFAYMPIRATMTKVSGSPMFSWLNVGVTSGI